MKSIRIAGALTAAAALAVPASAFAHGSVYESVAKVIPDANNPAATVDEPRYMITNHGFTMALRESNGATNQGMVDYKVLPSAYRKRPGFTMTDLLGEGDTGAQPHATCRGVATLDQAAVLAWQDAEPFYNYVPWQKDAAGLEDDPARWIAVVKAKTGVDLTTEDPATACAAEGGTYTPADEIVSSAKALAAGPIEEETAPLTAEIGTLTAALTTAEGAKAALQTALDAAKAALLKLATPVKVALPSAKVKRAALAKGTTVTLSGLAGTPVAVKLTIGEQQARNMKLKSSVLASTKTAFGADGKASVVLRPGKAARRALAKRKRSLAITVTAQSGDRIGSSGGTLTR